MIYERMVQANSMYLLSLSYHIVKDAITLEGLRKKLKKDLLQHLEFWHHAEQSRVRIFAWALQ